MVEAKCMNGHVFEVTKDMVGVTKSGTSFKATCPECRAPAQLTHAKVIEIMGLADNKEARALKEKMARELKESGEAKPSAKSPSTPKKAALRPSHVEIEDEPEDEGEDEVIAPYAPSAPTLPVELVDTHSLSEMLGEALNNRSRPSAPAQSIRRPHPPIDVMGTAANIRDRNDILRDTIGATNLPDPIKSKVTRFIDLKPEGLAPHELYSVLTYLGVGNAPALAVVRAYEFDLSLQQKELEQEKQVFSLLGVPLPGTNQPNQSQYPGPGVLPSGNPAPPQSNASSNPFLTPLPRPSGGSNTPPVENKPPQIDPTALLPLAMQNPQAFQMLASNPQLMQAVAQNPALMVQFVQMAGNASNQQKPKDEGMSRDEVRAIVSAELGELKKILVESKADRKDDALVEELKQNRAFMFEMMKSQTAAASAPRNDPMAEHQSKITEVLLQNLLDSQNRDNTGIILGALEELKKNQTGIGSGSQSIEGMNLFLRYQELMNQMDETKQKYQDEREKRESLKEIVNTAAETVGDTVAGVIEQSIGGKQTPPEFQPGGGTNPSQPMFSKGHMRPTVNHDDAEDDTPAPHGDHANQRVRRPPSAGGGMATLECLKCGAPIYVPAGSERAECPACHEKFRITRPPHPPEDAPTQDEIQTPEDPKGDVIPPDEGPEE